ncbi:hypothetical protein L1276_001967 [Flavobacterium sp. HSC-32F16]|uniref:hypothetical protein n=1 Tax=Flavobacterium sp. HSC-32F16 TaxID=2910964 RepID=UPI0020A23D16|nr:hypothetical protein [Flavobacterium sp. HSC-32F16]MCP2026823.1 hypothetical protein [Flavobacterium sp. HSC-32F16]
MDRLKLSLLVITALFFQQNSEAQSKSSEVELMAIDTKINESIFITPNSNSYLTGETLRYNLFCLNKLNNTVSPYSKIAYVELVDNSKKSVFKHKLFLEKGVANGDFFIPTTLETGNYKLVGYTSWMLNKSDSNYFNIDIYIVNPYQTNKNPKPEKSSIPQDITASSSVSTSGLALSLAKKIFANRELIDLKIKTESEDFSKGNYTVSVRKIDALVSKSKLNFTEYNASNPNQSNSIKTENFAIPELRGEIISGKIIAKTAGNSLVNKNIAISIPEKNFEFKISKTDQNGQFSFILDKPSPNSNIIIQLIDSDKENYGIEIDKPKSLNLESLKFNTFELSSNFNEILKERAIASQIENAYYNITKDSIALVKDSKKFYDPISKQYVLDDFNRFPTLKETIIEIVKEMYFTQTKGKYELHLHDYDVNYELSSPALVLVDGLIVQDINELFEYKMSNVYKINIVNGGYFYGTKLFNGLISFTTKNFDYVSKLDGSFIIKPEILRPLGKKNYYQPDYSDKTKNARIPDYRHQLLWLPDFKLKTTEENISFAASDVNGPFEIIVEGFSSSGKPVYTKEIIEVKDSQIN